jgi:hypothetical protein
MLMALDLNMDTAAIARPASITKRAAARRYAGACLFLFALGFGFQTCGTSSGQDPRSRYQDVPPNRGKPSRDQLRRTKYRIATTNRTMTRIVMIRPVPILKT